MEVSFKISKSMKDFRMLKYLKRKSLNVPYRDIILFDILQYFQVSVILTMFTAFVRQDFVLCLMSYTDDDTLMESIEHGL